MSEDAAKCTAASPKVTKEESATRKAQRERSELKTNMARAKRTGGEGNELLTRKEAMDRLRLKGSHFSKLVNGKIDGLPRLPVVKIGRRLLFRPEAVERWLIDVETT